MIPIGAVGTMLSPGNPASPTQAWRVVVIDDSPEDRADARRLLLHGSERRCIFTEASTGAGGVAAVLAARTPPDCVLLDYNLPDMDALEVLAALAGPDGLPICPVVVLTGSAGPAAGRLVLRAGAQDYVGKDWLTPPALNRAVENAIERLAMARELLLRDNALRRSRKELQSLADNTPDILTRFDSSLRHVFVNVAAEKASGRKRHELLGKTSRELGVPAALCNVWEDALQRVFAGGVAVSLEFAYQSLEGDRRFAEARLVPEPGPDDAVHDVLCVTHDVTERKRHEQTLFEADRRKDEFIALLAHELRNPLAPIRSGARVLRQTLDSATALQTLDMMDRQLDQMGRLINDLLDVSRITNGKVLLCLERLSVRSVFKAAVEAVKPHLDAKRHTLKINLPAQDMWIDGDHTRMIQVVGNLLSNAAKYSDEGGEVVLAAWPEAQDVVIQVSDRGMGIPIHMLGEIFEMFTQVSDTLDSAQGGLGLGLALVKRLVGLHGGTVTAESAGEGCGSRFTIRLAPAAPATSSAALTPDQPATLPSGQPTTARRVLVVDDNIDGATMLAMLLSLSGHDTRTAFSGTDALEVARKFRPDVVFLDIGLPGMNGFQVAGHFREDPLLRHAVLVALTGWGSDGDKQRTHEAGFDMHMTKPVAPDAFDKVLAGFDAMLARRIGTEPFAGAVETAV